jgi:hypothetical protein
MELNLITYDGYWILCATCCACCATCWCQQLCAAPLARIPPHFPFNVMNKLIVILYIRCWHLSICIV